MQYYLILMPLALLLIISKIMMKLCSKINIPAVIGMLLAGIIVGLLNYIPGQTILNPTAMDGLGFFAKIGVILIMFSAGLETDLRGIKAVGGPAVVITCAGVIIPLGLGFLVATLCNGGFGNLTRDTLITNLFYGTILTATSVSITVATLREYGKLNSKAGMTIIAAAIIDDVLGMIVLSFVLALKGGATGETVSPMLVLGKTILYFIVVAILSLGAKKFFNWIVLKYQHHRIIPIFSLAFCYIIAYVSEKYFGIADITGAYIVGLMLSSNPDTRYIDSKSDVLSYMIFAPIFFGNIGISTNFSGLTRETLFFGLMFILAGMVGKVLGCGLSALACKYSVNDSIKVGVGMMARAEVALVCAQKGVENGIIDTKIMPFIVLLIIITSFATPIILQLCYKHEAKLEKSHVDTPQNV